jgi:predicted KAP-like P-loop ATPase
LNDDLTPSTIGIYGDWGSGKSSLMEMLISKLSNEKEKNILCIKFNGWLFEGYEDAKVALIGTILDEINKKKRLSKKATDKLKELYENIDYIKLFSKLAKLSIDLFLTGGTFTLTDFTVTTIKNVLKKNGKEISSEDIKDILGILKNNKTSNETNKYLRERVTTFHKDFEQLLDEIKIDRLVVFIDELDRCNHSTILDTLEAIRLFLFAKGTSFVIGADERQIRYAVQMKYPTVEGNQIDIGKEYLEKLIQYPIRIPQLGQKEVEFYLMLLFFEKEYKDEIPAIKEIIKIGKENNFLEFELTYELIKETSPELAGKLKDTISLSKQISSVLSKRLKGNPRHCKRFLNTMELRIQMAKYRNIVLDRRILAKIMLVEYFNEAFYRRLAELQANSNGKPKEIILIENNKWEEAKELEMWKGDSGIKEWLKIEPQLSNINLKAYFYFSRESLKNISFNERQNLSIQAKGILEKLVGTSDSEREAAVKSFNTIPQYEAALIQKSLIKKMETSTEIDINVFKSLMAWSIIDESLHRDTLDYLERMFPDHIKAHLIPHIGEFALISNNTSIVKMIFSDWKEKNPKLTAAINNELENFK